MEPARPRAGSRSRFRPARCDDHVASYSSRGPSLVDGFLKPDILAPGNLIVSTMPKDSFLYTNCPSNQAGSLLLDAPYFAMCGTSMATPHAASGVALLMELAHWMPQIECRYGVDFVLLDGEEFVFDERHPYCLDIDCGP